MRAAPRHAVYLLRRHQALVRHIQPHHPAVGQPASGVQGPHGTWLAAHHVMQLHACVRQAGKDASHHVQADPRNGWAAW